jgi:hypothetical protein
MKTFPAAVTIAVAVAFAKVKWPDRVGEGEETEASGVGAISTKTRGLMNGGSQRRINRRLDLCQSSLRTA